MNTPMVFENSEFGKVRVVQKDGQPWFVANDIAQALGYENISRDIQRHCKHVELLKSTESVGLEIASRGLLIIPESDVYRLIMRSNLPKAIEFQDWVVEIVLPQIRQTGSYSMKQDKQFSLEEAKSAANFAKELFEIGDFHPNQIMIGMGKIYRHLTGIDILAISEIELIAPVQEQPLSPTDIGKQIGGLSAIKINKILLERGYQRKLANGKWDPTEKGKPYAVMLDTAKRNSDGTAVVQLKWYSSIIDFLK